MKTLHLNVKKQWFDMIASGFKKEEYREIKDYWVNRLMKADASFEKFDLIEFKNGYQKNAPTFIVKLNSIFIGKPKAKWSGNIFGNEIKDCFVISLGEIIENHD